MHVVAMMQCTKKEAKPTVDGDPAVGEVALLCVTGTDEEYKGFFKYTPWGNAALGILNSTAFAEFEEGAKYRVTFERV